jgi:hypothetical protein
MKESFLSHIFECGDNWMYRRFYRFSSLPPARQGNEMQNAPSKCLRDYRLQSSHLCGQVIERHNLGPHVILLPPEPEQRYKDGQSARDQARIVHRNRIDGQEEGEAVDDNEYQDVQARDCIDDEPDRPLHPKPTGADVLAPGEQVREDGGDVGEGGEDDKGADEGAEGGRGADVDASQDGGDAGTRGDAVERVLIFWRDLGEEGQRSQTDQRNGTGGSVPLVADHSEAS